MHAILFRNCTPISFAGIRRFSRLPHRQTAVQTIARWLRRQWPGLPQVPAWFVRHATLLPWQGHRVQSLSRGHVYLPSQLCWPLPAVFSVRCGLVSGGWSYRVKRVMSNTKNVFGECGEDRLTESVIDWFFGWLVGRLIDWWISEIWLAGLEIDWLIDGLVY